MRVSINDTVGVRTEVNKLLRQIADEDQFVSHQIASEIMTLTQKLAGLRQPAPSWVGALVHAKRSLEKRDPDSTAIGHIDQILTEYNERKFRDPALV